MPSLLEFRRVLLDRKSTRLNSSHTLISYADFCLKKNKSSRRRKTHAPASGDRSRASPAGGGRQQKRRSLEPARAVSQWRLQSLGGFVFFNDRAPAEIYPFPLHAALPI